MNSAIISPDSWTQLLVLDELYQYPERPLEVDIGCGKGRFLAERARTHPETNFLGIDRLLARLELVEKKLIRNESSNTRLLRIENSYATQNLLPPSSVSTFYIFFPDPWPKNRHQKRRLFTPTFMTSLHSRMTSEGVVHIATDHLDYFKGIEALLKGDDRFIPIEPFTPTEAERTDFERIFLAQGKTIGRCSYRRAS